MTSTLITLDQVSLAYGLHPLLDQIKLQINANERVCLIGRNGEGKSSLLKIIEGNIRPDAGNIWRKPHLRLARLAQELPHQSALTIYEFVAQGLAETGDILKHYQRALQNAGQSEQALAQVEKWQHEMDRVNAWQFEQKINAILTRLNLDPTQPLQQLSGGWQRRAALAQALVLEPELLLLDEPTNHLDIEAIEWLEEQLLQAQTSLLFITHDRALIQRLATRIIELDRGQLMSWTCDYKTYLLRKEEWLAQQAKHNADFDKKLAQEEKWIRQGIKARRTRNEGRVRALKAMRHERSRRCEVRGNVSFSLNEAEKSGQLVIVAEHLTHLLNDTPLIKNFSLRIMQGDRIGLIGPNGVGKTTLLNILLGNSEPTQGTVTQGTKLEIAYFDQMRAALDPEKTVLENVVEGKDTITINGKSQHIISYLNDFLFSKERVHTPVKALSGGECNRLLLARLFSKPANLLVLDEPTNDLDIETLELLEEILLAYQGTLLLVSHDRSFLDNVITSTLVFGQDGDIVEYVGGYQDYLQAVNLKMQPKLVEKPSMNKTVATTKRKLSYKEERELADLPALIESLENQQVQLQKTIAAPDFYKQTQDKITETMNVLNKLTETLTNAYARWEALEMLKQELKKG